MIRQFELVDRVRSYHPDVNEGLLNRAYVYSMKAHGSQTRASGDPYFSHPLEVAGILTDLKLDDATIVTALLHDTLEDTNATRDELEEAFGPEIAELVDGVTKLTRLELTSEESRQAENFRKLMIAMSNDIRVLLVKLADRLHNMRTLHHISRQDKRHRIAEETIDIYAPLAGRIGMQAMRDELEDLSFVVLNEDARDSILVRYKFLRESGGSLIKKVRQAIEGVVCDGGVEATVVGREKRPYSVWRKMEEKSVGFEQLADIFGFRVIAADEVACYAALGLIHRKWSMIPGRFKDYISTPKRNGYQSIHTTVIGPEGQRAEIQIRTARMHAIAERGVAAHWHYRDGQSGLSDIGAFNWLRDLVGDLAHGDTPEDFLEHTKLEMFHDQVFSFTPKGRLISLPRGATALDFAYAVHTDVGNRAVGVKINGARSKLNTGLNNGDQVEILLSDAQSPTLAWEGFVRTGRARAAIRRSVRDRNREQYIRLGRTIAESAFVNNGYEFAEKSIESALGRLRLDSVDEVYVRLGQGSLRGVKLIETVFPGAGTVDKRVARSNGGGGQEYGLPILGLEPGQAIHLSDCCCPIPGDRIVGLPNPGWGIDIHTIDCGYLQTLINEDIEWIDLKWDAGDSFNTSGIGRLRLEVTNEKGALGHIATIIGRHDGNIENLMITSRAADIFLMQVDIQVRDIKHLEHIKAALRATSVVTKLERDRGDAPN